MGLVFLFLAVLNLVVDFRSRRFAFRGRSGEPPRRYAPVGSPQPRTPAGVFVPSAQHRYKINNKL